MSNSLLPVNEQLADKVKEMLPDEFQQSLNKTLITQAFNVTYDKEGNPRFYVNRTGLLIFMEKKFRAKKAKYSMWPEFLNPEEEERIRKALRIPDDEPFIAMKGIVEITYPDGTKERFEDIGTASAKDCYHNRLVEMASTRATNRAMRLATSLGFTSVEELPEQEFKEQQEETRQNKKKIIEGETIDPDTPFKELPDHTRIKILAETDKLFRKIALKESDRRGEHITVDQIKQEMLEEFGVSSRKELNYKQLRELWKKARKRLEELEQKEIEELKENEEEIEVENLEELKNLQEEIFK